MKFEFARPYFMLLLLLLIPMMILSARKLYTGSKSKKALQLAVRGLMYLCLVLALSGLSVKWVTRKTTTIFLVDASDSVREQQTDVIRFVNDALADKTDRDYVGIVAFGSDAQVEQFVSQTVVFDEIQTDVNRTATDLESAVSLAIGLMQEDTAKRLVVITDGNENEGSIKNTVSSVVADNISVQVKNLESNRADEVYVSDISIPNSVGVGEEFNILVTIESNVQTTAKVSLYMGRTLKGQQQVAIQKGTNQFSFTDTQTDEGMKTYNVIIEAEDDTVTVNNEYSAYTDISLKRPIMLVEGERGQAKELEGIFESIGLRYETYAASAVPNTLSELMEYEAVVFVDVYEDDLRTGFEETLEEYVKDNGGGFIATGGTNSFGVGGYKDTLLEEILPVNMSVNSTQETPTIAFAMVIDHSGSMEDGDGQTTCLDLAKEAAIAALDNLEEKDYVGVLAFDDSFHWVVNMEKVTDRDEIAGQIAGIAIGGGTSIYPAFREAVYKIAKTDAMVKHIILLTDGEDGYEYSYYRNVIQAANDAGITVSTVSVGNFANTGLLSSIAEDCNGRMYETSFDTDIPRIFAQEVYLSSEAYIRNEEFVPAIVSSDSVLNGLADDGLPVLKGFVASTAKSNAITLLEADEEYPILTMWQYGLGTVVAWNSDFTGEWSANWSGTETAQRLWANLISRVTEDNGVEGAYAEIEQEGKTATILYHTEEYSSKTGVTAVISDDAGNSEEVELKPKKPGVYECDFDMDSTGVYTISVKQYEDGTIIGNLNTAAIMQYSPEYRFMESRNDMETYIASVGGKVIEEADEVFADKLENVKSRIDIATPLLILACIILLTDIAIRRFQTDPVASIRRKREKRRLQRAEKEAAAAELQHKRMMATTEESDITGNGEQESFHGTAEGTPADAGKGPDAGKQSVKGAKKASDTDRNHKKAQKEAETKRESTEAKKKEKKQKKKQKSEMLNPDALLNKINREDR